MPIPAGPTLDPAELPPEHSLQVGDVRVPTLNVVAPTAGTQVTCTVTTPGGMPQTLATSTPDDGATWVAASYTCISPGRWIETWTLTPSPP